MPTIAWQGTPAWRARVASSPTILPASVCSSMRPSPTMTACDARIRSSTASAPSTPRRPRFERGAERGPQPAREPAGGAGHRPAARVARQVAASASRRSPQARDRRAVGALLRREDRGGALERGADVAQDDERGPAQAAGRLDRGDGPGAAVGGRAAARGHEHHPRARVDRRRDQLAGAARARRPRRLGRRLADEAEAAGLGDLDHRRPAVLEQTEAGGHRPAERVVGLGPGRLPAQRGEQDGQRALAAVGQRAEVGRRLPARLQAARGGGRDLGGREGPLEGVGATRTGRRIDRASFLT